MDPFCYGHHNGIFARSYLRMSLFQPTRFLSPKEISRLFFLVHDEQQLHSKYSFENYFESPVNGKLIILLI